MLLRKWVGDVVNYRWFLRNLHIFLALLLYLQSYIMAVEFVRYQLPRFVSCQSPAVLSHCTHIQYVSMCVCVCRRLWSSTPKSHTPPATIRSFGYNNCEFAPIIAYRSRCLGSGLRDLLAVYVVCCLAGESRAAVPPKEQRAILSGNESAALHVLRNVTLKVQHEFVSSCISGAFALPQQISKHTFTSHQSQPKILCIFLQVCLLACDCKCMRRQQ